MPSAETVPAAVLVHHIGGRTRVRIPARRGDAAYFERLDRELAECPGVDEVQSSPLTGSVLLFHDADTDAVWEHARQHDLFEWPAQRDEPSTVDIGARLTQRVLDADRWVRATAGPDTDLRAVVLSALMMGGVWQTLRGRVLPPSGTLFWYALTLLPVALLQSDRERP